MEHKVIRPREQCVCWRSDVSAVTLSHFLLPGKAYAPEFYYDTYNPVWQNRHRVYSYSLQWTQMNPDAVDRIVAYRLGIRQVRSLVPVLICFCFLSCYLLLRLWCCHFLFIFSMYYRIFLISKFYFILWQYCFTETAQN